ncbi:MAG TPA: hypothetical protein VGD01_01305 [Candidatus Elarobacter sp.]|jgi:hypothetical protein
MSAERVVSREPRIAGLEVVMRNLRAAFSVRALLLAVRSAAPERRSLVAVLERTVAHRMRVPCGDGGVCDVFLEDERSIAMAIGEGVNDRVVQMLATGTILLDDGNAVLAGLQHRAKHALETPRPDGARIAQIALVECADLLCDLECHGSEPVRAQLLYGALLLALMRARIAVEDRWLVVDADILDEVRLIDPVLAGWIAVAVRRPFTAASLPALRRRIETLVERRSQWRAILPERAGDASGRDARRVGGPTPA